MLYIFLLLLLDTFQRTVEEAIAKAVQSENTVTALSHELKQKDLTIEELQRKLEQLTTVETIGGNVGSMSSLPSSLSSTMNPNDLAVFNKNDGGLHGVARDVEEVVTLLQVCSLFYPFRLCLDVFFCSIYSTVFVVMR